MTGRTVRMGLAGCAAALLLGGAATTASAADAPPPLELGAVRIVPRCLGFGENAGPELRISYALSTAARVNFTVQQRSAPGLPVPSRCPSALKPGTNLAAYTSVTGIDVAADAGPGVATVQPGAIARAAARPAARPPRILTRTVAATKGRHTIALLRALRATGTFAPGRYRVLIQAFRDDGAVSRMATAWFWVLRPVAARRAHR